jgi:hypothetical protein
VNIKIHAYDSEKPPWKLRKIMMSFCALKSVPRKLITSFLGRRLQLWQLYVIRHVGAERHIEKKMDSFLPPRNEMSGE